MPRLGEGLIVADGVVVGVEIGVVHGEAQGGNAVAAYAVGVENGVGLVGGGEPPSVPFKTIAGGEDVVGETAVFDVEVHGEAAVGAAMGGNDGVFGAGCGERNAVPEMRGLVVANGVVDGGVGVAADNHGVVDEAVAFPAVGQTEDAVGYIVGEGGVVVGVGQIVFGDDLGVVGDVDGSDGGEDFGDRVAEVCGLSDVATLAKDLAVAETVLNGVADGVVNGYLAIFVECADDDDGAVGAFVGGDLEEGGVLGAEGVASAVDDEGGGFAAADGEVESGVVVASHMERKMEETVATEGVGEEEEGVGDVGVEGNIVEAEGGQIVFEDGGVDVVVGVFVDSEREDASGVAAVDGGVGGVGCWRGDVGVELSVFFP